MNRTLFNLTLLHSTWTKLTNTDTQASQLTARCVVKTRCGLVSPCLPPHTPGPPCNVSELQELCVATPGCGGFNTDGYIKAAPLGTRRAMQGVTTYILHTVSSGPWQLSPSPPTPGPGPAPTPAPSPPFPIVEDWHFPSEELGVEASGWARPPSVTALTATTNTSGLLLLSANATSSAALRFPGDTGLGWTLVCFLIGDGAVRAVLERDYARWGLIGFFSAASVPLLLRKGVGRTSALQRPRYSLADHSPSYWRDTRDDPHDLVKTRALAASEFGEATFDAFASLLPPTKDYMEVGNIGSHSKFSLALDGRVRSANFSIYSPTLVGNSTTGHEPSALLFDPRDVVRWWPPHNFSEYKSAVVGRYTRAVAIAAFDAPSGRGFSLLAVPNTRRGIETEPYDRAEVLIRVVDATGARNASTPVATYAYYGVESCLPAECLVATARPKRVLGDGGAELYAHLLAHAATFDSLFGPTSKSMRVAIAADGTEGTRLVDMARATIGASMANFVGLRPNYGDGTNYWSVAQKDRGSLPLESYAIDHALLLWGLVDEAAARVQFYLDTYVRAATGYAPLNHTGMVATRGRPGSIDLKQWSAACVFADGLADYGRWLELWVDVARATIARDEQSSWPSATWSQIRLLAEYTRGLRARNSTAPGSPGAGMIWGSGEHDTCADPQNFYSTSLWAWRGWTALARFLGDVEGSAAAALPGAAALKAALETDAAELKAIVDANLAHDSMPVAGGAIFLPPWAAANMTPYTSMVEKNAPLPGGYAGGASYANFRYYSETLSSGGLSPELAFGLQRFRESRSGTLSGMTRFQDHLDDMPATGYARAGLESDRVDAYLSLLFGHVANYHSRGTFQATEQLSLYGDGGTVARHFAYADSYRGQLDAGRNEVDLDFCVPSTTLVAFMLRWMLVFEGRDDDVVWLLKGAPRRFFAPARSTYAVEAGAPLNASTYVANAPTRYGDVGVTIAAIAAATHGDAVATIEATVRIDLRGRGFVGGSAAASSALVVALRLRDFRGSCPPSAKGTRMTAELVWSRGTAVASPAMSFDVRTEMCNVTLQRPPAASGEGYAHFRVRAGFKCIN